MTKQNQKVENNVSNLSDLNPKKENNALKRVQADAAKKQQPKAKTKTVPRKQEMQVRVTFRGAPYEAFKGSGSRQAFSAYTLAGLIAAGFMDLTAKGTPVQSRRKGSASVLRAIIGATAFGYWTAKTNRINTGEGKLTAAGLNECGRRLNGESSFKTTADAVRLFRDAIEGKTESAKVNDRTYNFKTVLTVTK